MKKTVPEDAVLIPNNAEKVFQGIIYDVYHWQQVQFDGSTATFEMLRRPDTVDVLGVIGNKLLVLQDDQPHRGIRISLPGGRVDPDEDTLRAAQRETLQETGYTFDNWHHIKTWQPHAHIEWFVHLYLAWGGDALPQPLQLDSGERISVARLSLDGLKAALESPQGRHLGLIREVVEPLGSTHDLFSLPVFNGIEIER